MLRANISYLYTAGRDPETQPQQEHLADPALQGVRFEQIFEMLENCPKLSKIITGELHLDDRSKITKPSETLITTMDSNSSWWTNWVIPAISALVIALMYHFYTSEH
uniref:Cytochrome b5 n=1 Tax=Phocoena sinus TaxID=42100 RepID=A0A8C9CR18_PHOSS